MNTELSADDSSDDRNGRIPSRCASERLSQKYDEPMVGDEANQEDETSSKANLKKLLSEGVDIKTDPDAPYDAAYNSSTHGDGNPN